MWEDPIVKETREAREELFARFDHDLGALCRFLREKQNEHAERVVLEPRRPEPPSSRKSKRSSPEG
jgi:hypothetical protein